MEQIPGNSGSIPRQGASKVRLLILIVVTLLSFNHVIDEKKGEIIMKLKTYFRFSVVVQGAITMKQPKRYGNQTSKNPLSGARESGSLPFSP